MASGNELLFAPSHDSSDVNGSAGSKVQGPRLTTELPSRLLFSNSSGGSLPCFLPRVRPPTIRWLTETAKSWPTWPG
ncbi:hypothetical protein HPB48_000366 [Haemaphysalis longicornis]|uniref:Uncharacterized protein n=1 Tax=Haemaphysalis longicornis TaxID=44386 RepID=A0A9J6GCR0_HAELO|nr:hypothetical protein HPB48_000366 [Haemaphysalis longicornis]